MDSPDLLITFLGRTPKEQGSYRLTSYDFGDGTTPTVPVAFFGWALHERLHPKRILILGTSGSMWDHLFETDLDLGEQDEELRLQLIDSTKTKAVTQEQLDSLAPLLKKQLGCNIDLMIIPYCRDDAEQSALLRHVSRHVGIGERVHLDVTHGFRHLPMLALLAALHLRLVRSAHIEDIWYGSFDPDTREAPVYRLNGLLRIADWLQALSTFDKDSDYGVFAQLLAADGLPEDKTRALGLASHDENMLSFGRARAHLGTARQAFNSIGGISELYIPLLLERTDWIKEQDDANRLSRLTRNALAEGDFMRAAILLPLAFAERLKRPGENTSDYNVLEAIEEEYRKGLRGLVHLKSEYEKAKRLRNSLAHASRPRDATTRRNLESPELLEKEMRRLIKVLLT